MARITVVNDDGEVIETFLDMDGEIGDLNSTWNRAAFLNLLDEAVARARAEDGRNARGHLIADGITVAQEEEDEG
jgi:hypothetical protein